MTTTRKVRFRTPVTAGEDRRGVAACRHADLELFFPEGKAGPAVEQTERAKRGHPGDHRPGPDRTPCGPP
jgi:hypothetical protein